jgi:hypothetical protein
MGSTDHTSLYVGVGLGIIGLVLILYWAGLM